MKNKSLFPCYCLMKWSIVHIDNCVESELMCSLCMEKYFVISLISCVFFIIVETTLIANINRPNY